MERRNERKPLLLVTDRVEELFQASDTVMAPTSKLEKVSWILYIFVLAALVGFALNVHKYIQRDNVSEACYLVYFGIAATVYSSAILSSIPMLCTIRRQPSTTGTTATHHFKGLNLIFSVLFIISGVHKVLLFISYDPPFASAKHFGDAVTVIHYLSEAYLFIWLLSTTYRPYSTEEYDNVKSYYKAYLCVILSVNLMAFSRLIFVDYNKEKVDPNSLLYSVGTFDIAYRFLELSYIAKLFFYLWRPLEDIAVPNEKIEKRTENSEMRLQRHVFYGGLGLSLAWATAMCILVIVLWMDCSEDPETCSNTAYLVVYIVGHAAAVVLSIFQIISVRAANAWDYASFAPHIQLLFAGAMTAFVYIVLFIFDIGRRFSISQIDLTLGSEIAAMTSTTCLAIFILYYYKTKGTINGRTLAVRIQWMFSVAFFIGYHIGIILINFISSKTVEFTFVGGFEAVIFAVAEVMHIIAAFMCIDIADPTFLGA